MSSLISRMRFVRPVNSVWMKSPLKIVFIRGYPGRSEMSENDPKVLNSVGRAKQGKIEKEKTMETENREEHSQTISHAPGWNETLASESEANVF